MKITKTEIMKEIDFYIDLIKSFESRGMRGSIYDFEQLARLYLLLGDIKKAREYFIECEKSWQWYLENYEVYKRYDRRRWNIWDHMDYYRKRIPVIFLAYGKEKAREFAKQNIKDIEQMERVLQSNGEIC